jgi:hypothetical protein
VALLAAALLLDLGSFHELEHGDSILPVLVSLERLTAFYWDQDRYGMLVPLLARPIVDPLWNLLFQRGVLVFCGLASVVLLARQTLRDWPLVGALSAALLLLLAPASWRFEYLGDQPYGLSLALALTGLALAEPGATGPRRAGRVAAGLALVLLAHWVNAATGVLLLLISLGRAALDRLDGTATATVRSRLKVDAALLVAGLAAGQALMRLLAPPAERSALSQGLLPVEAWPTAWLRLLSRAAAEGSTWWLCLLAVAVLGALLLRTPAGRGVRRDALLRAGSLLAAALSYGLFVGTLRWVADNDGHPRYLAPAVVLAHLAAWSLVAAPLARAARLARPAVGAALLGLPLAALIVAGPPSLSKVRADLDQVAGRYTPEVLLARCEVVVGDYWAVWPAVWHALWTLHERGLDRPVYGLAHRAGPTVDAWRRPPYEAVRLCRPKGADAGWPALTPYWMRHYHAWPVRVVERRATLDVLLLAPPLE